MGLFNPLPFASYIPNGLPQIAPAPVIAGGMAAPATGTSNPVWSGLKSGVYGAGQQIANTGEAVARAVGAGGLGDTLAGMAQRAGVAERGAANPQYENAPWSPGGLVYQLTQGLPALVGGGAAALGGEALGPALGVSRLAGGLIGAGASQYPLVTGGNVQAAKEANEGQLTQGSALGALGLGVPEAAIGAILPHRLTGALGGLESSVAKGAPLSAIAAQAFKGALTSAAIQAPVAAAQTALTQFMGDPERPIADRAHDIVQSALMGAFQGGVFGGAVHALSRAPINDTSTEAIASAVDQDLKATPPEPAQTGQPALPSTPEEPTPTATPVAGNWTVKDGVGYPPEPVTSVKALPVTPEPVIQVPPEPLVNTDDASLLRQVTNFQPNDPQRQMVLAEIARRVQSRETPQVTAGEAGPDSSETTVPSPQDLESARADVKKWVSGKRIPDELDPVQQVALHQELIQRENDGRPFKRLEPLAQKLGLLNEDGTVVRPSAEDQPSSSGPRALGASEPDQPVGNAPPRDTIPEAAQPSFDALDNVSKQIAKSKFTPDEKKTLVDHIDAAKSELLDGKKQSIAQADQLVKAITDTRTIEPEKTNAIREPSAAGLPVREQPGGGEGVPISNAEGSKTPVQGEGKGNAEASVKAGTKAKPLADLTDIKAKVQDALNQHAKLETSVKLPENATASAKADFAAHMTQQRKTLEAVKAAADKGDNAKLAKLASTVDTSQDGFRSGKIFDVAANYVKPNTLRENALFDHGDAEESLKTSLHNAFPPETPRIAASGEVTPHDQALEELVNTGGSGRDALDFMRQHGSNGFVKAYASLLRRNGVDPKVQFASQEGVKFDNSRVTPGNAQSSYNVGSDRVNLYDRSYMEQSLLHEMTHAATMKALASDSATAREAQRLFDVLKSRAPDNDAYGLTNPKEMIAEALSNPTFRDFLKGESVSTSSRVGDLWQAIKNMVFKALRMPESMRTMFDQVMENAHSLIGENTTMGRTGDLETPSVRPGTTVAIDNDYHKMVITETRVAENAAKIVAAEAKGLVRNLTPKIRGTLLGWMNSDRIADAWGHLVPNAMKFINERSKLAARNESFAQFSRGAMRLTEALKPEDRTRLSELMALTQLDIDPRKTWAQHDWLYGDKNAAELSKVVDDANKEWNNLKRVGGDKAYEALHAANDAHLHANNALAMSEVVKTGFAKEFAKGEFARDHFNEFQYDNGARNDPTQAKAFWQGASDRMNAELKAYIANENAEAAKLPTAAAQRARLGETATLRSVLSNVEENNERINRAPNFHLGRTGDYMVSARIAPTLDGKPNNAAIEKIQKALGVNGFHEIMVQRNAENGSIYMRVENPDQMQRLRDVMTELQKQEGILDKTKDIASGLAANVNIQRDVSPAWMHKMIVAAREAIPKLPEDADPKMKAEYKAAVDALKDQMARAWLDMLPDNSVRKIYQPRMNVQGANSDMLENFKRRAGVSARALANNSTQRAVSDALVGMKNDVRGLVESNKIKSNDKIAAAQAVNELLLRDAQRKWTVPTPGLDRMRAIAHTFEVGSSPAYVMTLLSQIGTLSWGELGKTHGYAKSFSSLASNTGMAFRVMRGAMMGGDGSHFGLNEEGLRKAGVPEKIIDFIMHHSNRGDFNLASYTQAMVGHEHGVFGKYTSPLNAMGLYSEMFPRILTALAAKDLYDNHPASNPARYTKMGDEGFHQFVSDKVRGSQFTWDATNNPRATTKGGPFGPASPLINQFMGFKIKMIEKLYDETEKAFVGAKGLTDPKEIAQSKSEARRFLVAHLAATTVLAGTLAVPFAGAFAGAYDRVANALTGEDNNDIQAQYRTYLANTFGKDVGEIAARGLPRALGFDLSHLGDQNLLPGTQLLQDKRKLADQESDWLKSMAGSSVGMVFNDLAGVRDIANGDYMNGLIKMVPELLRNPLEAARLAQHGFTDKTGTKLPITADAKDIMLKAIGLDPAKEAEYDEAKRVQAGAAALRSARSQNITEHLVLAQQRGDQDGLSYWLGQSQRFGADHPGLRPPAMTLQRSLMQHMQAGMVARSTGTPIGVRPADIAGRRDTSFANFGQ